MKICLAWTVAFLALKFLKASGTNGNDENTRKDNISSSFDGINLKSTLARKRKAIIDPLSEGTAAQKPRHSSSSSNIPAPLVISAPSNMLFEDLLEEVSARIPTDSGVEVIIDIKDMLQHDPKTFVDQIEPKILARSNFLVESSQNGYWKIDSNADSNEVKAIGFIAGLCLKHKILLPFRLEPIYLLAMTGRMNSDSLTEIMQEFEPQEYAKLRTLRGNCDQGLSSLQLSFAEFGLADEPVTHANLERYISFKLKSILYYQKERVFANFLQGVRLVVYPAVINREYTLNSIMDIVSPVYDYTGAQLKACANMGNYEAYSQQYEIFFRAVDNLTRFHRIKLLKFFTELDRLPAENDSKIRIDFNQPIGGQHLLPKAMFCFHQLFLTPVESYEQMLHDLRIVADHFDY